jgi:protein-S-isoprenylcysteine O-methyltransferase Ste14
MTPYLEVTIVLACFAAFHLLTARETVKASIQKTIHASTSTYTGLRALVSLSLLILSVALLFHRAGDTGKLFHPYQGVPAILPALAAFWIAGKALQQVSKAQRLPQFFGFQEYPRLFIFTGAYTICRHPMYTGWLVASWGILLSKPYLLTVCYNIVLTGIVVFMSLAEEQRMQALFGDRYRAYQKQIPFLLPYGLIKLALQRPGPDQS